MGFSIKNRVVFLFLVFIYQTSIGQTSPNYTFFNEVNFGTVTTSENSNLTIAIDVDPAGNIYRLTFGNGLIRYQSNGLNPTTIISGDQLDAPLDFAIDTNNNIYILDFEDQNPYTDNGKIRIFDNLGQSINTIYTSYFRPLGIALDSENNIYVAIYNDGSGAESTISSEIRIYDHNDYSLLKKFKGTSGHPLNTPYRLAIDSKNNLFVSHTANNGEVLVFDSNYNYLETLDTKADPQGDKLGSPGSIVIDAKDYIHVIDYRNRVDFTKILNYQDLGTFEAFNLANNIDQGVKNQEFNIRIYDSDRNFVSKFYDYEKDKLKFPIDLAFDNCRSNMYVDNSRPDLSNLFSPKLDFNLLFYKRTPSLDTTAPYFTYCPSDLYTRLDPGETTYRLGYTTPIAADNCGVTVTRIEGQASGTLFEAGVHQITYEAVDFSGNTAFCSFTFTVDPADQPPSFQNCSGDIRVSNDPGECGAIVTFPTPTASDENGNVPVTRTDNGPASGELFPVGTTTITFEATDDQGNTSTCEFDVIVTDDEDPVFSFCPDPVDVTIQEGEVYKIPNFVNAAVASDNCGNPTISQDIAAGTEITTDQNLTVTLTATDASNNAASCTVDVKVTVIKRPFSCKTASSITIQLDDNGQALLQPDDVIDITGDISGYEFTWSKQDFTCDDAGKSQDVTMSYTNGDDSGECVIAVKVQDSIDPSITCPADTTVSVPAGQSYTLPDFTAGASADDNCRISKITQDPLPGTEITSDTIVTLTAEDPSGNTADCSFTVSVVAGSTLQLNCPGDYEISSNNNCEFIVPNFENILTYSPSEATIQQSIAAGTALNYNEAQNIAITARYEGQEESCVISLVLVSDPPVLVCPSDQIITVAEGESVSLPDYSNDLEVYNCGDVEIVQNPAAGTSITQDTEVTFAVTDSAGREVSCSFNVQLVSETTLAISCLTNYEVSADENCSYFVPDFSEILDYSPADAVISQDLEPGSEIDPNSDPYVTVTATYGSQTETCNIYLELKDNTPPVMNCKGTYDIVIAEGGSYFLDPQELDNVSYDNCSDQLSFSLSKSEFSSADAGENTVVLTATDEAGNSASCEVIVYVVVDTAGNQKPIANTDQYSTTVNTVLNINAANGVLKNDSDPEGDSLSATLDQNVSNGSLEFNADGSFIYTPNTGFVGEDFFTYHVSDGQNNSGTVTVIITVTPDASGDFNCAQQVVIGLDEDGERQLNLTDLYFGNADGLEISASQLLFTCDDIGENTVTLTYTGRLTGSCEVPVTVIDDTSPVLRVKDISIDLNLEGVATIDFKDIDDGSFDGCDDNVTYSLSKYIFSCSDVGENIIEVTAEDHSGNVTVTEVVVKVYAEAGICDKPAEGSEYVFIYPNPNSGHFKVATPGDVTIERIEVFDNRGRFICSRTFDESDSIYEMELGPLQEAVYVLKIVTSEGEIMKRLIFKR